MTRRIFRIAASAALLTFVVSAPVRAHSGDEGAGISVEPAEFTAGSTVVLAGQGLEPNTERQINLVGPDVVIGFPAVTTDGDGMFAVTLTVPNHLPSGAYRFQAIGDETLEAPCTIRAAAGMGSTEPKNEAAAVVQTRDRSTVETAAIGLFVLLAIGLGALLVLRAERVGRGPGHEVAA